MSKVIIIKKRTILYLLLSIFFGFSMLFCLEHFGRFRYETETIYNENTEPTFVTYSSGDKPIKLIFYDTYFGNTIVTNGNGYNIADLNYSETDFDKYSVKSYYYLEALFKDYAYGFLISSAFFGIMLLLSNYKIKIS